MRKTIIQNCFLVLLIVAGLNLIYRFTFYQKDLEEKYPEAQLLRESQDTTDIYYFGESSDFTTHPGDTNKKSISSLVQDFFPSLKITTVDKPATHAGIYRKWLQQLEMPAPRPKAIIVTLNLRSFDATWRHSKLETQLQEGFVLTRPFPAIINRFFLSLQFFDNKTAEEREQEMLEEWRTTPLEFPFPFKYSTVTEWDQAMANGTYLNEDGSWNVPKITLACHYIKTYAFNIKEDNERLQDFDAIYSWCAKNNVRLFYNLMAENIEYADSLVGRELVFLMKQNRDILVERYNKGICTVIDNLERVEGSSFIDQDWTTEHYDFSGRLSIARNASNTLKKFFQQHYKKAY